MNLSDIKTIDVLGKEWFDKLKGKPPKVKRNVCKEVADLECLYDIIVEFQQKEMLKNNHS